MKYFIDTEFLNYKHQPKILGLNIGKAINTVELISIGIVSENINIGKFPELKEYCINNNYGQKKETVLYKKIPCYSNREYYAISKDFNLKEAWNNEWVRENVLKPIHYELTLNTRSSYFSYSEVEKYINKYGKTNKQIAEEIIDFVYNGFCYEHLDKGCYHFEEKDSHYRCDLDNKFQAREPIEFYGYYSSFDYVVFSQLFGDFSQYPKEFPIYFVDLKQTLDNIIDNAWSNELIKALNLSEKTKYDDKLNAIQNSPNYPKQLNEHNALSDAKWNYELYKFLKSI